MIFTPSTGADFGSAAAPPPFLALCHLRVLLQTHFKYLLAAPSAATNADYVAAAGATVPRGDAASSTDGGDGAAVLETSRHWRGKH